MQDLETTAALLVQVRSGDRGARDRLIRRYLPILQRWAAGRLPRNARSLTDTDDLVQVTLLRALDKVKEFEPRREGAFLAYLRSILLNQIRDQLRSAGRRPQMEPIPIEARDDLPSPLERAIGQDTLESYEKALHELTETQREAVILKVELGFTYREMADALDSPSPNAARMLVTRALTRLAEVMDERG